MRQLKQLDVKKYGFWGAMLLLIYISYLWRLESSLWTLNDFSYDEGIHLILGKLWAAGYTPYEQIFVSYPPIFLWSLGLPWKLFSQVSALRFLMTTYALLGVVATMYLATVYDGRLAGVMAGTFLSFAPDYFIPSMFIMGEVPSIGIAVVAVALAEKYRRGGSWPWLVITGGALAFSLSLKVLPFYAAPFVGLMVISKHVFSENRPSPPTPLPVGEGSRASDGVRAIFSFLVAVSQKLSHSLKSRVDFLRQLIQPPLLRDVSILAASFIIVFILPLLFFNPPALYDQVVGMRLVSREAQLNPFESNNKDIIEFMFGNPGLMALALYGLIFVVGRNLRQYGLLLAWLGFIWISMYFHVPLRGKHLSIFLPPLAVFAGFGVNHIFGFFRQLKADWPSLRGLAMLLTILTVLGMVGWSVPRVVAENNGQTGELEVNQEREIAISFIQKIATPTDCVIADNPVFLYNTQRLPPPELSETSQTRIDTGYLTLQDIVQSIETSNCHVVAVVTPRFGEISGLKDWLVDHYLGLYAQSETYVYFAKKGAASKYTPVQNGDFEGMVRLHGWQQENQPETPVYLSLFWELDKPVDADYLEQITLRSATGQTYHISRSPFEGQFNPTHWQPGEQVRDTFQLELPADLPPDTYQLYLSLCHTEQPEVCLPINNQTVLRLGQLELN